MKKRRLCATQTRSPKRISPRLPQYSGNLEVFSAKTKNFQDPKYRRLQRGNFKLPSTVGDHGDEVIVKKDVFSSLESLFDVKKPFTFPEGLATTVEYQIESNIIKNLEARTLRSPRNFVHTLYSPTRSPRINFKSSLLEKVFEINEIEVEKSYPEETDETGPTEVLTENSQNQIDIKINMSDSFEETTSAMYQDEDDREENPDGGQEAIGEYDEMEDTRIDERSRPTVNSSSLTETVVIKEMKAADERCTIIAKEIDQLKQELAELTEKEDLTQEDTIAIQKKQEDVMTKLAEFETITRKLQKVLGLSDPSSYTFAKMFGMLAYPHGKETLPFTDDATGECNEFDSQVKRSLRRLKEVSDKFRFDLPPSEYPEDQLPRVIICGDTEENIPKIVVPDSSRRGKKKCLQALTGRLSQSLTMQEKLVRENAQLEGGKYQLEEALLEKDSAVESLQRKVCGLQAEMRIVVKENSELSRQLACLSQRVSGPSCSSICPGAIPSSPSSPPALRENSYCRCQCCATPGNVVCASPENFYAGFGDVGSPRLSGGASHRSFHSSEESLQIENMCCRNPATTKQPCPPLPCPPRGTCPAELENKLTTYQTSTKQLEQQLGNMECEVRNMQLELASVQRERQQLEQQRKLLKCTGPCAPCGCSPPQISGSPGGFMSGPPMGPSSMGSPMGPSMGPPMPTPPPPTSPSISQPKVPMFFDPVRYGSLERYYYKLDRQKW